MPKRRRSSRIIERLLRSNGFVFAREVVLNLICLYFRVEVKGMGHIPRTGPVIVVANHSGYAAIDAVVLAHLIHLHAGRRPRIMAHRGYFEWFSWLKEVSFGVGLRKPELASGLRTLRHGHLLIVFPEGAAGNFKSSLKRYRLQPFHSGFARMATRLRIPIVPCVITGAEDAHLNLGNFNLEQYLQAVRIPLPVNLIPFPSKWRIRFLRPIPPARLGRRDSVEAVRSEIQNALNREVRKRPYVYFKHIL